MKVKILLDTWLSTQLSDDSDKISIVIQYFVENGVLGREFSFNLSWLYKHFEHLLMCCKAPDFLWRVSCTWACDVLYRSGDTG